MRLRTAGLAPTSTLRSVGLRNGSRSTVAPIAISAGSPSSLRDTNRTHPPRAGGPPRRPGPPRLSMVTRAPGANSWTRAMIETSSPRCPGPASTPARPRHAKVTCPCHSIHCALTIRG